MFREFCVFAAAVVLGVASASAAVSMNNVQVYRIATLEVEGVNDLNVRQWDDLNYSYNYTTYGLEPSRFYQDGTTPGGWPVASLSSQGTLFNRWTSDGAYEGQNFVRHRFTLGRDAVGSISGILRAFASKSGQQGDGAVATHWVRARVINVATGANLFSRVARVDITDGDIVTLSQDNPISKTFVLPAGRYDVTIDSYFDADIPYQVSASISTGAYTTGYVPNWQLDFNLTDASITSIAADNRSAIPTPTAVGIGLAVLVGAVARRRR